MNVRQIMTFLNCPFVSPTVLSNQHLSGQRSNIFLKVNANKMTILISVTSLEIHLVSLIREAEAKVSKCEIGLTSWDTSASEKQIPLNHRGGWVGAEGSLDFTGCDSPRLKIFMDSHLDRPECLWQLLVCGQTSPIEIHFAIFCVPEEWSLPMANLPDYTIASWLHNLTPLRPLSGNTCCKPLKQANPFQLQIKPNLPSAIHLQQNAWRVQLPLSPREYLGAKACG